jgi:hypothetical protein
VAERWNLVELESALADLSAHIDFPPTPDLATRIRTRLMAPMRRTSVWQRLTASPLRAALVSLAIVLVALGALVAASPQVRTAVANRLGLRGAPIEQVSSVPTPPPDGAALDLGEPATLEQARASLPLLVVPMRPDLGEPDEVYVARTLLGGTVSLVYAIRPDLAARPETGVSLLMLESRLPPSGFEPAILGKVAGPGTRLEELSVNGGRGVWVEGAPHELFLPDATGQFRPERVRLAANVLLWEQAGLLVRLEGSFSRNQALEIAASVK